MGSRKSFFKSVSGHPRIDAGQQSMIGVNTYRPESETPVALLKVDNEDVQRFIRSSGVEATRLKTRRKRTPASELAAVAKARGSKKVQ